MLEEVSLTTNTMLLERLARPLADGGLTRVNISLDTLDPKKFKRITRGEIERVRKGITAAEQAGLAPLKLNTVIVRGLNSDELPALARLTMENPWHVRFNEVMPTGIILVNSNPLDVVKIFKLSRASYRKIIQNLWWAAGYNIIAIPLAAGVLVSWGILLSPAIGIANVHQHDCGCAQRTVTS